VRGLEAVEGMKKMAWGEDYRWWKGLLAPNSNFAGQIRI
jgi:hypothetical protein